MGTTKTYRVTTTDDVVLGGSTIEIQADHMFTDELGSLLLCSSNRDTVGAFAMGTWVRAVQVDAVNEKKEEK